MLRFKKTAGILQRPRRTAVKAAQACSTTPLLHHNLEAYRRNVKFFPQKNTHIRAYEQTRGCFLIALDALAFMFLIISV